jgi:hypothetical protein
MLMLTNKIMTIMQISVHERKRSIYREEHENCNVLNIHKVGRGKL